MFLKKNFLLIILSVLVPLSSRICAVGDGPGIFDILDENLDFVGATIIKNYKASLGVALASSAGLALLFKNKVIKQYKKIKEFGKDKFYDVLVKLFEIKEDGLSKSDKANICALLVLCSGLYLTKDLINYESLKTLLGYLKIYKIEIGAGVLGLIAGNCFYKLFLGKDMATRFTDIEKFFQNLTDEQKMEILNSDELLTLLGEAKDDISVLVDSKEFNNLLTPIQRKKLLLIGEALNDSDNEELNA